MLWDIGGTPLLAVHHNCPVLPTRPSAARARPASAAILQGNSSQSKRARKDRGPNWTPQEILLLIAAKRDMFLEDLDTVHGRDLMTPNHSKWMRISQEVMRAGLSPCVRDSPACKTKWNQILPDYKRIADYFTRTGTNVPDYWEMSASDRKSEGLPKQFLEEFFRAIHEWFGDRPQITLPHVCDILRPNDSNYRPHDTGHNDGNHDHDDTDNTMDLLGIDDTDGNGGMTPPHSPPMAASTPSSRPAPSAFVGTPVSRPVRGVSAGITPVVISSSDTCENVVKRRGGNTAIRRKNLTGHSVIVEATKATGLIMAQHMQDIAESSRDLERSKIDVQLKLFSEQMLNQREKDKRLYENALAANENARLSILKQGEMVSCLAHLSNVLSKTLNMDNGRFPSTMPESAGQGNDTASVPFDTTVPLHSEVAPSGTSTEAPLEGSDDEPTANQNTELVQNL